MNIKLELNRSLNLHVDNINKLHVSLNFDYGGRYTTFYGHPGILTPSTGYLLPLSKEPLEHL